MYTKSKVTAEIVPFGHPTEICVSFVDAQFLTQPLCFSHNHYDNARDNLERLATCWNEHDTLKAKAELFPELLTACKAIHKVIGEGDPIVIANVCAGLVIPTIAKAEAIK